MISSLKQNMFALRNSSDDALSPGTYTLSSPRYPSLTSQLQHLPVDMGPMEQMHCSQDALTDSFGWFIQAVLAFLAFLLLVLKRFCEPKRYRRQWMIWFYDTSKQLLGAMVIHFANVFLASMFHGDPCTWYIVSFLLDSSVGLLIIFIGIRSAQWLAKRKGWSAFSFGEYGKPPLWVAWLGQCGVYITLMVIEKVLITCLIQLDFWNDVRQFILSPIKDPKLEVAIVVLLIPFVINAVMFWVVDNFLMRKHHKTKDDYKDEIAKRKIRYKKGDRHEDAEAEVLLSADDEINVSSEHVAVEMTINHSSIHRHPSNTTALT